MLPVTSRRGAGCGGKTGCSAPPSPPPLGQTRWHRESRGLRQRRGRDPPPGAGRPEPRTPRASGWGGGSAPCEEQEQHRNTDTHCREASLMSHRDVRAPQRGWRCGVASAPTLWPSPARHGRCTMPGCGPLLPVPPARDPWGRCVTVERGATPSGAELLAQALLQELPGLLHLPEHPPRWHLSPRSQAGDTASGTTAQMGASHVSWPFLAAFPVPDLSLLAVPSAASRHTQPRALWSPSVTHLHHPQLAPGQGSPACG